MNKNIKTIKQTKKNKKKFKRKMFMFIIVGLGIIVFAYKAPIFNVKDVTFSGLVSLKEGTLKDEIKDEIGKNIFLVDYTTIKEKLLMNPYIKNISVKKVGINKLNVDIKENGVAFYIDGDTKKIINNKLIVVESLDNIDDKNLVKLIGVNAADKKVGDKVSDNVDLDDAISKIYSIIEEMPKEHRFSWIDLSDLSNIKGEIGEIEVKLGNVDKIIDKMNIVLNAIDQGKITKGYIDVSFEGTPVLKQED